MNEEKILVAGGGIGGLTAAIAMAQAGFAVRIFEQSRQLGEVGAGLTLAAPATRVLDALGLGDRLRDRADLPTRQAVLDYRTLQAVVEGMDGQRTSGGDGRSMLHQIHRADFHALLVERAAELGVEVQLGEKVVGYAADDEGVTVSLSDGAPVRGALLVAADGVRSAARDFMHPGATAAFTGQVAYRALIPIERVAGLIGDYESATVMGPKAIFTRYLIRRGALLNCVGIVRTDSWTEEGWSHHATLDETLAHFAGWHPSVIQMLGEAPEGSIVKWAIYDHPPLSRWAKGRVALLGDAAHPMMPFLGQGAAMAIEDAMILSRCLRQDADVPLALRRYEATRKPRASAAQANSREQGRLYQRGSAADYAAGSRPASNTAFFVYDSSTAPLEPVSA